MTYYHGTTNESADCIEQEGFNGSELNKFTSGFNTGNRDGVVFVTDSIEEAKEYGEIVFEIELLNGEAVFFQESPVGGAKEYYIDCETLRNDGIWRKL